jgi:hypothetical protein
VEPVDGAPCFFTGSITPGGCGLPSTDSLSGFVSAGNRKIQGGIPSESGNLALKCSNNTERPVSRSADIESLRPSRAHRRHSLDASVAMHTPSAGTVKVGGYLPRPAKGALELNCTHD